MSTFRNLAASPPVPERIRRHAEVLCGILDPQVSVKFLHLGYLYYALDIESYPTLPNIKEFEKVPRQFRFARGAVVRRAFIIPPTDNCAAQFHQEGL